MTQSVEEMIDLYLVAWNKKDPEEFKAAFAACWAEDATYVDPNFELAGLDALAELASESLPLSPTRIFSLVTTPDHHHNVGRYTWKVDLPDQSREGYDYFEFNAAYKITRLVSFFGPLQ